MSARSSTRYDNLYSKLFQGPPTPFATGIGFAGSIGLIGFILLPGMPGSDPKFFGDPSPPSSLLFKPAKATTFDFPCL